METTLREIVLAIPALSKLAAAPLRLRSAYRLQKLTSALQKEADFFAEQRQKILSAYGEADSSGEYHFRQSRSRKLSPSWKNCWIWQSPRRVNGSPCR